MNKPLIAFHSFPQEKTTCLDIINWGERKGDKIEYPTKNGLQRKFPNEIENRNVKIVSFEDIDLSKSLFYWYKNNPEAYSLPIEIDYNLTQGEIYKDNFWKMSLMIQKTQRQNKS